MKVDGKKVSKNALTQLVESWDEVLNDTRAGVVDESKRAAVAQVLQLQEEQFAKDPIYRDEKFAQQFGSDAGGALTEAYVGNLNEAMISGDVGGATNSPAGISAGQTTGAAVHTAPIIMGLVRRTIPQTVAFDLAGVQPTNAPSGEIYAYRAVYGKDPRAKDAKEIWHPMYQANAMFSGQGAAEVFPKIEKDFELKQGKIAHYTFRETGIQFYQAMEDVTFTGANEDELEAEVIGLVAKGTLAETAAGMATSVAELQENYNGSKNNPMAEVGFRIDKSAFTTKTRQLRSTFSKEMAQDLSAVHRINIVTSLNEILTSEIMLEIDREIISHINAMAQVGKSGLTHRAGTAVGVWDAFDPIDIGGARWDGERYKALVSQIDKDAVEVGRQTGRGPANWVLCSRGVVNALSQTDAFVSPAAAGISTQFNQDTSKSCFAGILGGKYRVYIDRTAAFDYYTVGYKGASAMDAGIFYVPYVPLTPHEAQYPDSFNKVIGFSTRYALGVNPFVNSYAQRPEDQITSAMIGPDLFGKNAYFRRVIVKNL